MFFEIRMLCYMVTSHTNTRTVRGRPTPKKGNKAFSEWTGSRT